MLDVLNVRLGLRHEDIVVGRNTGRNEFPSHIRTLGKFRKLSDFLVVLDGDSRKMENELKAIAQGYGHQLQPLFLPGKTSPEQWLWKILHARAGDYAGTLGLTVADMTTMTQRVMNLVAGAVHRRDEAKTALGAFADEIGRTVPDIARAVGKVEAENNTIPELLAGLEEQIARWRNF